MSNVRSDEARSRLAALRLGAVAKDHLGLGDLTITPVPGGAVGRRDGIVVGAAEPDSSLSALAVAAAALVWSERVGATTIHLVGEGPAAGELARLGRHFDPPAQSWDVTGGDVGPAEPVALPQPAPVTDAVGAAADELRRAGADIVVEGGAVVAEIDGLEFARVVGDGAGGARLEVGVGAVDKEAWTAMGEALGIAPATAELMKVADEVRRQRSPGSTHPFARLAPEGALRARLVREPGLVGADSLAPLATTRRRPDLRTPWPAAATGDDLEGRPLLVVCSVGIHPAALLEAAELRSADSRRPRAIVAVPERDRHELLERAGRRLSPPVDVVAVSP